MFFVVISFCPQVSVYPEQHCDSATPSLERSSLTSSIFGIQTQAYPLVVKQLICVRHQQVLCIRQVQDGGLMVVGSSRERHKHMADLEHTTHSRYAYFAWGSQPLYNLTQAISFLYFLCAISKQIEFTEARNCLFLFHCDLQSCLFVDMVPKFHRNQQRYSGASAA